jgi:hypothetical protein
MKPKAEAAGMVLDANQALKNYTSDPEWLFKTGLGCMLTAACLLVTLLDLQHLMFVPLSLALSAVISGYLLRVIRTRVGDPTATKMAAWGDWADLFMAGITWITIQFGLAVIFATIVSTTLLLAYYALITPSSNSLAIAEATLASILLLLFWVHFLTTFLWVNFAVEERVSAGLALRKVVRRIRKNPRVFLQAWALTCGLQILAVILPAATVLGLVIVPTTLFAAQLLSANILAQAWLAVED